MTAGYRIVENARLDARNTFGVAARAPMLVDVADAAALPELFGYAMLRDGPVLASISNAARRCGARALLTTSRR